MDDPYATSANGVLTKKVIKGLKSKKNIHISKDEIAMKPKKPKLDTPGSTLSLINEDVITTGTLKADIIEGPVNMDNIKIDTNTISSTTGGISITPASGQTTTITRLVMSEKARFHNITTANKLLIVSPQAGDTVYDTTVNTLSYFNGTNWFVPSVLSCQLTAGLPINSNNITITSWTVQANNPAGISIDSGNISFAYSGIFEVHASFVFAFDVGSGGLSEFATVMFKNDSEDDIASAKGSVFRDDTALEMALTVPISCTFHTSGSTTYKFVVDCLNHGSSSVQLSNQSNFFIKRIL